MVVQFRLYISLYIPHCIGLNTLDCFCCVRVCGLFPSQCAAGFEQGFSACWRCSLLFHNLKKREEWQWCCIYPSFLHCLQCRFSPWILWFSQRVRLDISTSFKCILLLRFVSVYSKVWIGHSPKKPSSCSRHPVVWIWRYWLQRWCVLWRAPFFSVPHFSTLDPGSRRPPTWVWFRLRFHPVIRSLSFTVTNCLLMEGSVWIISIILYGLDLTL